MFDREKATESSRNRLIKILEDANETVVGFCIDGDIGVLADCILSKGGIVPPCSPGDTVWIVRKYDVIAGIAQEVIKSAYLSEVSVTSCEEVVITQKFTFNDFGEVVFCDYIDAMEKFKSTQVEHRGE